MKYCKFTYLLILSAGMASAQTTAESIVERIRDFDADRNAVIAPIFANPAAKQFAHAVSLGTISVGYNGRHDSELINASEGRGTNEGFFDASAFIHSGSSTLWGNASYVNGRTKDIRWCEASDYELVYPYVSADATGGFMNHEKYSFSGGYGHTSKSIIWGATLSYDAGLYYRSRDPRPRNVTGCLDLTAGIAMKLASDYFAGVFGDMRKYKQTNEITFMSELGEDKIYHLTGLGGNYNRFAGLGKSAYYTGWRWGAGLSLLPKSMSGLFASADFHRFTFDYILKDLNRLPMADVTDDQFSAMLAWRTGAPGNSRGIGLDWSMTHRKGRENIFGDAVTGVYPQIATLEMYADDRQRIGMNAIWEHSNGRLGFSILPKVNYDHRHSLHASPFREMTVDALWEQLDLSASLTERVWYGKLTLTGCNYNPVKDSVRGMDLLGTLPELVESVISDFNFTNTDSWGMGTRLEFTHVVAKRYAIGLTADYRHISYKGGVHRDAVSASVNFKF